MAPKWRRATFRPYAFRTVLLVVFLVLAPPGGWRGKRDSSKLSSKRTPRTPNKPPATPAVFCCLFDSRSKEPHEPQVHPSKRRALGAF
jgi:hypothetical protein